VGELGGDCAMGRVISAEELGEHLQTRCVGRLSRLSTAVTATPALHFVCSLGGGCWSYKTLTSYPHEIISVIFFFTLKAAMHHNFLQVQRENTILCFLMFKPRNPKGINFHTRIVFLLCGRYQ